MISFYIIHPAFLVPVADQIGLQETKRRFKSSKTAFSGVRDGILVVCRVPRNDLHDLLTTGPLFDAHLHF